MTSGLGRVCVKARGGKPASPWEEKWVGTASEGASVLNCLPPSCFQRGGVKWVFLFLARKACFFLFGGVMLLQAGNPTIAGLWILALRFISHQHGRTQTPEPWDQQRRLRIVKARKSQNCIWPTQPWAKHHKWAGQDLVSGNSQCGLGKERDRLITLVQDSKCYWNPGRAFWKSLHYRGTDLCSKKATLNWKRCAVFSGWNASLHCYAWVSST